ncbi:hypothetical protein EMN47_12005 [Prolixibacteraceae bacterium JC049]|nr:hypothetical protein [Prolixibacteraceae bacterium JC049]
MQKKKQIILPNDSRNDYIFKLIFSIDYEKRLPSVQLVIVQNPKLKLSIETSPPTEEKNFIHSFSRDGVCEIDYSSEDNFYIKGTLKTIIHRAMYAGDSDFEINFLCGLEYGEKGVIKRVMSGIFELDDFD